MNGVELCVETFGDATSPAILLISGAAASMDWWDPEFCGRLAAGGRFVIRYDHRDTGRSVGYPPGRPGYTAGDLAADAVALIDVVAGGRAHLAGLSMGGGIAQVIAANHPDKVISLVLMSTSPIERDEADAELPPMTAELRAVFDQPPPDPDWNDRQAVVEYLVETDRAFAGPDGFDEAFTRRVAGRVVERTTNLESSAKNHWLVVGGDDEADPARLSQVRAPTLVIHGTRDPLFPPEHGQALARIRGEQLLMLDGVGHQVPPPSTWDVVVPAMLSHTGRA